MLGASLALLWVTWHSSWLFSSRKTEGYPPGIVRGIRALSPFSLLVTCSYSKWMVPYPMIYVNIRHLRYFHLFPSQTKRPGNLFRCGEERQSGGSGRRGGMDRKTWKSFYTHCSSSATVGYWVDRITQHFSCKAALLDSLEMSVYALLAAKSLYNVEGERK